MTRFAIALALTLLWQAAAAYTPTPVRHISYKDARAMEMAGDLRNALRFYESLARSGDGNAVLRLGLLYENGTPGGELRPDRERAMNLYHEARLFVVLPPRIVKLLATWQPKQPPAASEDGLGKSQARGGAACSIYRLRWDEACWGKDGSYRYKTSEECTNAAYRLYDACWPGTPGK